MGTIIGNGIRFEEFFLGHLAATGALDTQNDGQTDPRIEARVYADDSDSEALVEPQRGGGQSGRPLTFESNGYYYRVEPEVTNGAPDPCRVVIRRCVGGPCAPKSRN